MLLGKLNFLSNEVGVQRGELDVDLQGVGNVPQFEPGLSGLLMPRMLMLFVIGFVSLASQHYHHHNTNILDTIFRGVFVGIRKENQREEAIISFEFLLLF